MYISTRMPSRREVKAFAQIPETHAAISHRIDHYSCKTLVRTVKLTAIILLVGLLQVSGKSAAQQHISISIRSATLEKAFAEIEKRSGYTVFYNVEVLKAAGLVTLDIKDASIEDVMRQCLKGLPLEFTVQEKTIFVKKDTRKVAVDPNSGLGGPIPSTLSGMVRTETGAPLMGATVYVLKLKKTLVTDKDGVFTLKDISDGEYEVIISYVGYESYKTKVMVTNHEAWLNADLKQSMNKLDETVVKGYYNTTSRLNTGDVTTVKGEDITEQPVSDPILALEGRVPGLNIQQTSGAPGAYSTIRIMGQNSILNGNDPLYIVDGVPYSSTSITSPYIGGGMLGYPLSNGQNQGGAGLSPFNSLNPADIESIEVLKDADATAIYGSRGANGVILITTKKGKTGKTRVDANVYSGAGKVTRTIPFMNSQQYLAMRNEAFQNDGLTPQAGYDYDLIGWDTTRYTDWQKVLIGNSATFTNAQVGLSGGSGNTQFAAGGGYSSQGTVFPGSYSDRKASGYLNLTHSSIDNRFHMQMMANYVNDNNSLPSTDLTSQITLAPDAPKIYNADGSLNWEYINGASTFANPLSYSLITASTKSDNFIGNLNMSYQIINGLHLKSNFGYNDMHVAQAILTPGTFYPAPYNDIASNRQSSFANTQAKSWIIEPQITYDKALLGGQLNTLIGTTFQENTRVTAGEITSGYNSDLLIDDPAAASSVYFAGSASTLYHYDALFGRIGYAWQEKYLLNLTGRRDGSSRFGPGKQFGNFGAVGAAWVFSKESFVSNSLSFLSFGKLRVSYGVTGNDQIGDYQFLSTYNSTGRTYQGLAGLSPTSLTNPNFAWEQVRKLETGMELGLFKDRLLISATYFRNRSSDQLVGYVLPFVTGFSSVQANLPATVQNSGGEFVVNTINLKTKNFSWTSSINLTIPENKLLAFPNIQNSPYRYSFFVGKSLFSSYVYNSTGVDPQSGLYSFTTKNAQSWNPTPVTDYIVSKPVTQSLYGGFENNLSYMGFQLSFLFQFVKQLGYNYFASIGFMPGMVNFNQPQWALSHWQKPGDLTSVEMYSTQFGNAYTAFTNYQRSTTVISDASFIRLKNLALSYELPARWKKATHLQKAAVYLQAQNLLTITRYKGLDPETAGQNLPPLRMITGGVRVGL
jgi:TonB-linked SusC/RagA family outer membrane protein